jgi:hypothetical protein
MNVFLSIFAVILRCFIYFVISYIIAHTVVKLRAVLPAMAVITLIYAVSLFFYGEPAINHITAMFAVSAYTFVSFVKLSKSKAALHCQMTDIYSKKIITAYVFFLIILVSVGILQNHPVISVYSVALVSISFACSFASVLTVVFSKNYGKVYYRRIYQATSLRGVVSSATVRRWATYSKKKKAKGEHQKTLRVHDLLCRMCEQGELILWEGEDERYYFLPGYDRKLKAFLKNKLMSVNFIPTEEILMEKSLFVPFTPNDLELFLAENISNLLIGHRDGKPILALSQAQEEGGLCEYCKAHVDALIKRGTGNFCSNECARLMEELAGVKLPALTGGNSSSTYEAEGIAPCVFDEKAQDTFLLATSGEVFRRAAENNVMLKIEVPYDQYEEIVLSAKDGFKENIIPAVLTLAQARSIARFALSPRIGISENGLVICTNPKGITAEVMQSVKTGSHSFAAVELSLKLDSSSGGSAGSNLAAMVSSDVVEGVAKKLFSSSLKGVRAGVGIGLAAAALFNYRDFANYFSGNISGKQLAVNVSGAGVGAVAGGVASSFLGIIPGLIVGGLAGAATDAIVAMFASSDGQKAQIVLLRELRILARDYMLGDEEIKEILSFLLRQDSGSLILGITKADNPYKAAAKVIMPAVGRCMKSRRDNSIVNLGQHRTNGGEYIGERIFLS